MMSDKPRTNGYYDGIMTNREAFEGKVAIDVGAGNGILSYFAARAGARKVYSIEASGLATLLQENMKKNHLGDTVEVIQAMAENVKLPEKADVIVSEAFGYFAVFERMLETWLLARDRFLK